MATRLLEPVSQRTVIRLTGISRPNIVKLAKKAAAMKQVPDQVWATGRVPERSAHPGPSQVVAAARQASPLGWPVAKKAAPHPGAQASGR